MAAEREIVSTRVFDAPREYVWEAFRDPDRLRQWWGPNGFTNTIQEFDLQPGGKWRLIMHGPGGADYHNESTFLEVVQPSRVVYQHEEPVHRFQMAMNFDDEGDRTKVTWRMRFESAEEFEKVKAFIAAANEQNFDRLAEHLTMTADAQQMFSVTRVFDAPRDLVWKAWTEQERLAKWWGPKGFSFLSGQLDLRPGGLFHYGMRSPDGKEMWGKFVYREVVPPERLVFVVSFSDTSGGTTRHPMSATWPLEVLNTLTLTEQNGQTMVTIQGHPIHATDEERKTFEAHRSSMQQGFQGTMDQLADYLAKA